MGTRNYDSSFLTKHRADRIISYAFRQRMDNSGNVVSIMNPQTGVTTASLFDVVKEGTVAVNYRAFGRTVQENCCGNTFYPNGNASNPPYDSITNNSQQ